MKLVVCLGNPGRKYEQTRHNVGFAVARLLAADGGAGKPKKTFDGELVDANIGGQRVLLLCPHTYMNLSGGSVLAARDFYKLDHCDVMVVCDDFNLPLGQLRIRAKGSGGGQNGLADIINRLGSNEIPRLRIGIGPVPGRVDPARFVLSRFRAEERESIELALRLAADAVGVWAAEGIDEAMNRYNG